MKKIYLGLAALVLSLAMLMGCSSPNGGSNPGFSDKAWTKGTGTEFVMAYKLEMNIPGVGSSTVYSFGIGDEENPIYIVCTPFEGSNPPTGHITKGFYADNTEAPATEYTGGTFTITVSGNSAEVLVTGLTGDMAPLNGTWSGLVENPNYTFFK